jgi:hypothetical protein
MFKGKPPLLIRYLIYKSKKFFWRFRIFHPYLLSLYPLAFNFSHNAADVNANVIVIPAICIIFGVFILSKIIYLFTRDKLKTGVLISILTGFFFSYGHLIFLIKNGVLKQLKLGEDYIIFPIWMVLLGLSIFFLIRSKNNFHKITRVLNFTSAILISIPLFSTLSLFIENNQISNLSPRVSNNINNPINNNLPDIYYIIAERYPSEKSLDKYFNYDNRGFITFLRKNNFYVADDSKSNYMITYLSLASSLNMNYLDGYIKKVSKDTIDRNPLINLIQNNYVIWYLKNKGYKYVHIGSNWIPTISNKAADVNFPYQKNLLSSEYDENFLQTTMIYPFISKFLSTSKIDVRSQHRILINGQVKNLKQATKITGPKFVFAHLFLSHPPFVYDDKGDEVSQADEDKLTLNENKVNLLKWANGQYEDLIKTILTNSKTDPIIIIQSDEGPYFQRLWANNYYFNMHTATPDELKEKSWVLNAYHLPNGFNSKLYPNISPVNSFRLIFDLYFQDKFPLLPDKTIGHESFSRPYRQFDITNIVQ